MSTGALIFMLAAWAVVLGLTTWSYIVATWVAHDLGHIARTARVMVAKQYREAIGPWRAYLSIMDR